VVGICEFALVLDLFAFDADVGDPVLSATVGAAGDVEAKLLVELRYALFKFVDKPAGKTLRLRDGELAEFGACAGDGATPEICSFDVKANLAEFAHEFADLGVRHVSEEQVLRNGGPELAAAKALGEFGCGFQLFSCQAAT